MNAGPAIKAIADEKGMRAVDICNATGISDSYISMLLSGKIADPKLDRIYVISRALDVSIDYIVQVAKSLENNAD